MSLLVNYYVNLKSSIHPDQITDRTQYHPQILELQLFPEDMNDPEKIIALIRSLHNQNIRVYLHHPMRFQGEFYDLLSTDSAMVVALYQDAHLLDRICRTTNVYCVFHLHYGTGPSAQIDQSNTTWLRERSKQLGKALMHLLQELGYRTAKESFFLFENSTIGLFSCENPYWIEAIVKPFDLPVCMDTSHALIALHGDLLAFDRWMHAIQPYVCYYHVVDSVGTNGHDALPLDEGRIDWSRYKAQITKHDFIFEIGLHDQLDCTMMITSGQYFTSLA
nr:TIM barrel protein [Bacilli bacterium]